MEWVTRLRAVLADDIGRDLAEQFDTQAADLVPETFDQGICQYNMATFVGPLRKLVEIGRQTAELDVVLAVEGGRRRRQTALQGGFAQPLRGGHAHGGGTLAQSRVFGDRDANADGGSAQGLRVAARAAAAGLGAALRRQRSGHAGASANR